MRCLVLASSETNFMQSETQELVNNLSRAEYVVQLLHVNVGSLELYRALGEETIELVWVTGHAGPQGFLFGNVYISSKELGLFLSQARSRDVVLNACHTEEHVVEIQRRANCNVLATIKPSIDDSAAWLTALYLAKKLAEVDNLEQAYLEVIAVGNSDYRWFPAPRKIGGREKMKEKEEGFQDLQRSVRQVEITVSKLVVALQGDEWTGQDGLIDLTKELKREVADVKERIKTVEQQISTNKLVVNRRGLVYLVLIFLLLALGIMYLTYTLGGYSIAVNSIYPLYLDLGLYLTNRY